MSGDRPARPVAAEFGEPVSEWCAICKAYSLVCSPLYLITADGVTLHQHIALCTIHDNADHDERPSRIPRR